jgi:hypothetical protein
MWLKLNSYFEAVRRPPHLGIRTLIVALKTVTYFQFAALQV